MCRGLQYLDVASSAVPCAVHTEFVRLKVQLEAGDTEAAAAQIGRLMACDGFDPSILQVPHAVCFYCHRHGS